MKQKVSKDLLFYFVSSIPASLIIFLLPIVNGNGLLWVRFAVAWPLITVWMFLLFSFSPWSTTKMEVWPWPSLTTGLVLVFSILFYIPNQSTWVSWIIFITLYSVSLWMRPIPSENTRWIPRLIYYCLLAAVTAIIYVGIYSIETHFSEEEFFLATKVLYLFLIWLSLAWGLDFLSKKCSQRSIPGWSIVKRRCISIALFLFLAFACFLISSYHKSFYPQTMPPLYHNISYETPIQCFKTYPSTEKIFSDQVFSEILNLVEANPDKKAPEYGMLALGTKEKHWAQQFRNEILIDANAGLYTGPVNSIKVGQYEAALRLYYYWKVKELFPDLFSPEDQIVLKKWFNLINQRALTVEWIDWLYAFAFNYWPIGPYENQENGAGLLALLEVTGLSDPNLSTSNRAYLEKNPRGWQMRFRNTDDAIAYQPIWITNAFFQFLYTGKRSETNLRNSFEWIVSQAPPNLILQYNHPRSTSLVGIIYFGAALLNDPKYLWLAARGANFLKSLGGYIYAQPGSELPPPEKSLPINISDCLIYGDSGLPNQNGPLAPDKIVMRDGWQYDDLYLLLNLRFNGWHSYKGTGAIIIYQSGQPLATDVITEKRYFWLPAGRNQFRDKRIPRENLNAFTMKQTGIGYSLYILLGGSPWAQDPPSEASIVTFEKTNLFSKATIALSNWHGWNQKRTIFRINDGLFIVFDSISGPNNAQSALFWHITGKKTSDPAKFELGKNNIGELIIVGNSESTKVTQQPENSDNLNLQFTFSGPKGWLVSTFLSGKWKGSTIDLKELSDGFHITIKNNSNEVTIPITIDELSNSGGKN